MASILLALLRFFYRRPPSRLFSRSRTGTRACWRSTAPSGGGHSPRGPRSRSRRSSSRCPLRGSPSRPNRTTWPSTSLTPLGHPPSPPRAPPRIPARRLLAKAPPLSPFRTKTPSRSSSPSAREARLAWDSLVERIFRFTETMFAYAQNGPTGLLPPNLRQYGIRFKNEIEAWSDAFDHILASRTAPGSNEPGEDGHCRSQDGPDHEPSPVPNDLQRQRDALRQLHPTVQGDR